MLKIINYYNINSYFLKSNGKRSNTRRYVDK